MIRKKPCPALDGGAGTGFSAKSIPQKNCRASSGNHDGRLMVHFRERYALSYLLTIARLQGAGFRRLDIPHRATDPAFFQDPLRARATGRAHQRDRNLSVFFARAVLPGGISRQPADLVNELAFCS